MPISLVENQYRVAFMRFPHASIVFKKKMYLMRLYVCTNMTEESKCRKFFFVISESQKEETTVKING